MSKSRNKVDSLVNQLASANTRATSRGRSTTGAVKAGDLKQTSIPSLSRTSQIQFRKAPTGATDPKSTPHATSGLLTAVTGNLATGASKLLGLGDFAGIGSMVTGLFSLFGSAKSTPLPLPTFTLPGSVQNQLSIGNNTLSSNSSASSAGAYASLPDQTGNAQWLQQHNQQIAMAVKTALLQSSSLADVISEI